MDSVVDVYDVGVADALSSVNTSKPLCCLCPAILGKCADLTWMSTQHVSCPMSPFTPLIAVSSHPAGHCVSIGRIQWSSLQNLQPQIIADLQTHQTKRAEMAGRPGHGVTPRVNGNFTAVAPS